VSGRATKLTDVVQTRLVEALSEGNTRRASCDYAGISEDSLARWLKRSADFADAIKKAESEAERKHVANIVKAADGGNWTASAWWLERRRSDDWGRRDRLEHTGAEGGPILIKPVDYRTAIAPLAPSDADAS
jgi:hypothetical protein